MATIDAWHHETLGLRVVEKLTKNRFVAKYCPTYKDALEAILASIPPNSSVGVGGSMTVKELGLLEKLEENGHKVLNHNAPGLTKEESAAIRRSQLTCDVFLTSTNAITLDGKLVNTDGVGNRVASMIFGPKKVVVVVGINKIAKDVEDAIQRIEMMAAPMNNKRLQLPNPCTTTGQCMNCQNETRICNVTTILHKKPTLTEFEVYIVGEPLGY